ncbi:LysR family transcriptional regulator [Bosea sp. LC85]|uniref:LysR family transcriptional regulator n=1 Tax=Bosea sp. LC85 TaxID=1502851 RepID=UPI000A58E5CF|nr:LysR family transcriptional regulator [Bosea sp. LC85]
MNFDLNLVRIFEAMMSHRSVSGAAVALHLTQPAVSNALKRLRALTGDPLFVRTRYGMEPTQFALSASESLVEGLRLIRLGLDRAAPFDPASTNRRFRLLMTDAGEVVFLPYLMPLLRAEAPGLELKVMQLPVGRYLEALETDEADVAIGNLQATAGTLRLRRLFDETYALLCRKGHALTEGSGDERSALERFLAQDQIVVRPPNSTEPLLEVIARANKWSLRRTLDVPHFMVLASILAQTDLVAVVPGLVARELAQRAELAVLPVPFDVPSITIRIGWHGRHQADDGHRWLRQRIVAIMADRHRAVV